MIYGNFIGRKKYETTETLDGSKISDVPWVSGLIEGKGRHMDQITGILASKIINIHVSFKSYAQINLKVFVEWQIS